MDMDAFFASVEQLDAPDLMGKPVVVGGKSDRGVVAAASYEARRYGIHSAMPIFMARKKCRDLVIVPPRRKRYKEISRKVMAILSTVTPLVEQVSIDEAYLDVSGCEKLHGTYKQVALNIKKTIRKEVCLTCSVGMAPLKFLAKIASDMDKPDGLYMIAPENVDAFISTLPIEKVPGAGKIACKSLGIIGIRTLGDIKKVPEATLVSKFGKFGHRLLSLAKGQDASRVTPVSKTKSVSAEHTLHKNTTDRKLLSEHLRVHSREVGRQLRKHNFRAKTIHLKIKYEDFKQLTRSLTIANATQSSEVIYRQVKGLFNVLKIEKSIRLIGVGTSGLMPAGTPVQTGLFEDFEEKDADWEKVDRTIDRISEKFGKGFIQVGPLSEKT